MGRRRRYASRIDPLRTQAQHSNYKAELLTLGTVKTMMYTRSRHPGERRGFTLIELIIAIVVLGLLATLALMGFRATIDRSTDAKQRARTQSVLREARTLYVQKIYQDPSYTWQKAIIDATADLPTFRTNAFAEGVSATGGTNLNTATNSWTLEVDSGTLVYSSVSSELVFKVQSSTLYVASYNDATGNGVFGYVSQETPPVVWVASCSGSSCDAESATLGTPASGAYAPGTTTSGPTISYASGAFSSAQTSQVLSATTTGSPTAFSYTGTLPAGVSFSTSTGAFTGPSSFTAGVTQVAAGGGYGCAVASGAAKCWGKNTNGQLGDGTTANRTTPVQITGLTSGVTAVTAGESHACALLTTGAVKCWGKNTNGQLGDGTLTQSTTPVQVSSLTSGVTAIAAGGSHTCALLTTGAVRCWGLNTNGQLGDGTTTQRTTPVQVSSLTSGVTKIAAGDAHSCAVVSGAAQCWGWNIVGQLGDGSTTQRTTPVQVSGLTSGVTDVAAGVATASCAVVSGSARCWGWNQFFQLGDGTSTSRNTPVQVTGLTSGVSQISIGNNGCAVLTTGAMRCWGDGGNGTNGDGNFFSMSSPNHVRTVTGVATATQTSITSNTACAVLSSGALSCWGNNGYGQIGDGTTDNRSTPTNVSLPAGGAGFPASITVTATNASGSTSTAVTLSVS
jgi:prepilin-type N-terminal cleavage/methylation domain-containing protein